MNHQTQEKVLMVGGSRNAHGTRISRRITCCKCGVEDFITVRPRADGQTMCRACAQEEIKAYDAGVRIPKARKNLNCSQCRVEFHVIATAVVYGDILCADCRMGFATWQGSLDQAPEARATYEVERRVSGTMLRKRK